jgi:predicted aspartyl protease
VRSVDLQSEADKAYLHGDYDHAVELYRAQLQKRPDDAELVIKLARVQLKQQKVSDADKIIHNALDKTPKSVGLLTALGEIQYREGTPWLALQTSQDALKVDPCYGRLHLLNARLSYLNSDYAMAEKQIVAAHALDPFDPEIQLEWLDSLPLKQRATQLESYLLKDTGRDAESTKNLHTYLENIKKEIAQPRKVCQLVSDTKTATIPFAMMMEDSTRLKAFGLDVMFNNKRARLQVDTGAGGLVVSRSVAQRAGLKLVNKSKSWGIGDEGNVDAYTAFAEHIKIGSLEFQDCEVEVIDKENMSETDGLIGMDVFSKFLVTLDYPMRKVTLGPLPPRPDEAVANPTLETSNTSNRVDNESSTPDEVSGSNGQRAKPHDRYVDPSMETWTPVYRIGHILLIPTQLNNSKVKTFILDTGAFSTTITTTAAREVTKLSADDRWEITGVSGKVKKVYRAERITFRFANVSQEIRDVFSLDSPQTSKNLDMEVSGFIGATALIQMTVSIEYRDGLVKFSYDPKRGFHNITN